MLALFGFMYVVILPILILKEEVEFIVTPKSLRWVGEALGETHSKTHLDVSVSALAVLE